MKKCEWGNCKKEVVDPESSSFEGDLCSEHLSKFSVRWDGAEL
jgi:hypothetical protein